MRFVTLIALALAAALGAAADARATTVAIEPADTTAAVGDTLLIRAVITPVPDLKGYQLVHSFDPVRLALLDILPGDVLTGTGRSFASYSLPDAATPVDSTWFDAAMLDGATAGPGVLAYLVFVATATGVAHIECEHIELRDSVNAPIPFDCAGGLVRIAPPVPVLRSTWGRLKSVYR